MKKLILLISSLITLSLAGVQTTYLAGYEIWGEVTANVTVTPSSLFPYMTASPNNIPLVVDAVEIYPQTAGVTDIWYDAQKTTANVKVWKPVGSYLTNTNNGNLLPVSNFGINGICLKKDSGSAVVGVVWLRRSKIITN